MNRQRLILFILAILLLLALSWGYLSYPRQKTVNPLKYPLGSHLAAEKKRTPTQPSPQAAVNNPNVLRLDLLDRDQASFKGYQRNIFKPIFTDEVKIMKQKSVGVKPALPPVQGQKNSAVPQPALTPSAPAPETPQRELARFTFLGFLKKDSRQTIFLAKDKDIILVKKGDTFAGRYEAASITDQALTISVTDTGEEIVIPLIENKPLSAGSQPGPPSFGPGKNQ
ncbi:MAG TPA: hypothetical protein VGJ93_00335 [Desulfuromonadaceae bacterium]|jgi:hypothetical protein